MKGKVVLEEAFCHPKERAKEEWWAGMFAADVQKHCDEMIDLDKLRTKQADQYGVGYQILSYTAPGAQDIYDPPAADKFAKEMNDYIGTWLKKSGGDRYGSFA